MSCRCKINYNSYLDLEHALAGLTLDQLGQASENLVHWTICDLGRVGEGRSSRKIRRTKFIMPGNEIVNVGRLSLQWAKWAGPVKTWYTGPLMSGLFVP